MAGKRPWAEVLEFMDIEVSIGLTRADVERAYRRLRAAAGDDGAALTELNRARYEALQVVG